AYVCTLSYSLCILSFFFTDPATTEISTLSLHDALPISLAAGQLHAALADGRAVAVGEARDEVVGVGPAGGLLDLGLARAGLEEADRKSTRLNSSHVKISYAVFCLKKKKKKKKRRGVLPK